MKIGKKLIAIASAAVMAICCIPASVGSFRMTSSAASIDTNNDDWLHAVGDKLYDKQGNEVWLTGANWFGMNCQESFLHGLWSCDMSDTLQSIADHGINLLRIPVSTELLYYWMIGKPASASGINATNDPYYQFNPELVNSDGTQMNSLEVFDVFMKLCKQYGIKVMVDVHSPDANNSGHNYELWYGKEMSTGVMVTTEIWMDTWVWLVDRYKNDDTLIAVDLKNEPHGKRGYTAGSTCPTTIAKWDNSTDENNWKYASETCANKILEVNPNILIVVEGIEQYPKTELGYDWDTPDIYQPTESNPSKWYPAWWGGNLRGVKDYPLNLGANQDQLVYSPHDYGPSVYAQTWFNKDFTTQTLLDDYWYDTWAYIDDQGIAPLLIGEWGGFMDADKNQKWMTLLRDYMTENHINHTFWCINPNSGDTGGLLNQTFSAWDEEKYALLEEGLWQTDAGKYIGLDHVTALGVNGISLSEYYGESPSTETTTTPTGDLLGDVNKDGKITIADMVMVKKYVLGISSEKPELGDVNKDTKINSLDVSMYVKYLLGLITKF